MIQNASGTVIEGFEVGSLEIPDIKIFRSDPKSDSRGTVAPTYSQPFFDSLGLNFNLVHENHCWSAKAGTMRGFHYQLPPFGQAKLIRVTKGRLLDVNVDLRRSSPTFGRHTAVELSLDGWSQTLVPTGFAHCYVTLEDDTEVVFKLGCGFAPAAARGLAWNDPDLAVLWPVKQESVIVLERDMNRPRFCDLTDADLFP